jgi:hypothetical protein
MTRYKKIKESSEISSILNVFDEFYDVLGDNKGDIIGISNKISLNFYLIKD